MKINIIKFLIYNAIVICFFSCNEKYTDGYYSNGKLKIRTYYNDKEEDSVISFDVNEKVKWIKKIYNKDSLYLWDYTNGSKDKEGIMYKNSAYGKWKFYKDDVLSVVREYFWIDGQSYFNQEWHFDKAGDTVKDKGNYFKLISNNPLKTNTNEEIRFFFERPTSKYYENEMIVFYDIEFLNKSGEVQTDSGEILGVNNEVIYEVSFEDEGIFKMKGYVLEKYRFINDSTSEKISRTRKLYFDELIHVLN
ncbi:hypothetical protein [uncultured Winogradskyella sp.]|uniref:hypothetical protein n=1 Tax=uncultured Winogradskyella sp. TaxID=395353 RepID=UPI00262687AD|nr:hypothetical protein [uncultured Winogradskyella sp.]